MQLSQSLYLRVLAGLFTCITLAYGVIYLYSPLSTVAVFEFDRVPTADERYFFDPILALLGIKALFIAFANVVAIFFSSRKHAGVLQLATGAMAIGDGWAMKHYVGHGEWNHWGYSWLCALLGLMLMGVFDPVFDRKAPASKKKQ